MKSFQNYTSRNIMKDSTKSLCTTNFINSLFTVFHKYQEP